MITATSYLNIVIIFSHPFVSVHQRLSNTISLGQMALHVLTLVRTWMMLDAYGGGGGGGEWGRGNN